MADHDFEIAVWSTSCTSEEFRRAVNAPEAELQNLLPLSDGQKAIADIFDIDEEEYARGELARIYGKEGHRRRAKKLGNMIQEMVAKIDPANKLLAISYKEDTKRRWIFKIKTPLDVRNLTASDELVEDIVNDELFEAMQELKAYLKRKLAAEPQATKVETLL